MTSFFNIRLFVYIDNVCLVYPPSLIVQLYITFCSFYISTCFFTLYFLCYGDSIFFFISWRLITLQYCSSFCHTLTWISHGFTCIPHPNPPSHLPLYPIPLSLPSAQVRALVSCIQPGLVICFTLDNTHVSMLFSWNIPPSPSPTESKSLFYTSVSLFLFCI